MATTPKSVETFLPDFCSRETLLVVIVIAELLTFVLTMTRDGSFESLLRYFAVLSLFVLWIALTDVAMLCHLNRLMAKLSSGALGIIAFLLLQLVTLFYTAAVNFAGTHFEIVADWDPGWLMGEWSTQFFNQQYRFVYRTSLFLYSTSATTDGKGGVARARRGIASAHSPALSI